MKVERNVIANGNSLCIILPKQQADWLEVKEGDTLVLEDFEKHGERWFELKKKRG
jgi:antitoxin component of MazEF toxin-antitoxin module